MKTLFLLVTGFGLLVSSCYVGPDSIDKERAAKADAVSVEVPDCLISVNQWNKRISDLRDSCISLRISRRRDSVIIDSLKTQVILVTYKMGRMLHRANICINNPSQIKYLKGWNNRIIDNLPIFPITD